MLVLIRIEAPHYVAGIEMEVNGGKTKITREAPIVYWMKKNGLSMGDIERYCERKGYSYEKYKKEGVSK